MDQEEQDYGDGPRGLGWPPSLKELGCCFLFVILIFCAIILGLIKVFGGGIHDG